MSVSYTHLDVYKRQELDVLIKKLYETYAMGKLEEKRFELLCAEYEKEQRSWNSCLHPSRHSWTNFTRIRTVPATFWRWRRNIRISPS